MFKGARWLAFAALVLVGYLTIHNGWLDFIANQNEVANYLHSHGFGGCPSHGVPNDFCGC